MINCKAPEQHTHHIDIVDGVIVIFDSTPTFCTATTNIAAVLNELAAEISDIGKRLIVYRDATKSYDIVQHTGSRFTGFQPTNETVLEAALIKIRGHNVVPFCTSLSKH